MVVKPREFIVKGRHDLIQPTIKVRGRKYLHISYGPEYTLPEHLERLRSRGPGTKRSLALCGFALGPEPTNYSIESTKASLAFSRWKAKRLMRDKNPIPLNESIIRVSTTPQSFTRGMELYRAGAITNAAIQANTLSAHCEGTMEPYYRVAVEFDAAGIHHTSCTCAYEYGGYCKHVVALLLTYLHKPQSFAKRQPVAELFASWERDDLIALLTKLVDRQPELYDWIEAQVITPRATKTKARKKKPDAEVYRRQVRNVLHSLDGMRASEAYWGMGGLANGLREVQASAQKFLDAGDSDTALTILLALVEEFAESHAYEYLDDSNGEFGGFMDGVGLPLAEAILSANLSKVEREQIAKKLEKWKRALGDYGLEGDLDTAIQAATNGWEASPAPRTPPRVQPSRVIRDNDEWDEEDEDEAEEDDEEYGDTDSYSDLHPHADLTEAKLNVLERQGQTDAYLALCQKEGRHLRYARKLCELERVSEGMNYALDHLTRAEDALTLAQVLRELKHITESLTLSEHGLKLEGSKFHLGQWLAPLEEAQGRKAQALDAWFAAFSEQPSLETYKRLRQLGAKTWDELQPRAMSVLKKSWNKQPLVQVLLFEEQWDEAIEVAEKRDVYFGVVALVADAVISQRPAWVVQASKKQAEALIARTQSKYYAMAAEWLARCKKAYAQLKKKKEWNAYLNQLKETYKRRPALQAHLQRL